MHISFVYVDLLAAYRRGRHTVQGVRKKQNCARLKSQHVDVYISLRSCNDFQSVKLSRQLILYFSMKICNVIERISNIDLAIFYYLNQLRSSDLVALRPLVQFCPENFTCS